MNASPTNESKEKLKKYEELWCKIQDLIRSITKSSDYYDEKYMKIKLIQMTSYLIMSYPIVTKAAFHENNKYYPQNFLDECLYKI